MAPTNQQLQVQAIINIPEQYILIDKTEYEELKTNQLFGKFWTMTDLERVTQRKRVWLQENLLYVPAFKEQLEEFVYYPKSKGESWTFLASKMATFLEENFNKIFTK